MKRLLLIAALIAAVVLTEATRWSTSNAQPAGYCFSGPYNTLVSCSGSVGTPVPVLIQPVKQLALGGPISEVDNVSRYTIGLTSQFLCFTQNEPVDVFTSGQPGAAVIEPSIPTPGTPVSLLTAPQDQSQFVVVTPDANGQNLLGLEVYNPAVGAAGLSVHAFWPDESISRDVVVVPPAAGTPAASAPVATSAAPTTPAPTATATAGAFPLRVCIAPNPLTATGSGTVYASTAPGASCTAGIVYPGGFGEPSIAGPALVAGPDGLAIFPFVDTSGSLKGTATVTCTLNGVTESASAPFTAPRPPAVPGTGSAVILTLPCKPSIHTPQAGAIPNPGTVQAGQSEQIIACFWNNGVPVPVVYAKINVYYVNGLIQTCTTFTDVAGEAACTFDTTKSPPGFTAQVVVTFYYQGTLYQAGTNFTVAGVPTPVPTATP